MTVVNNNFTRATFTLFMSPTAVCYVYIPASGFLIQQAPSLPPFPPYLPRPTSPFPTIRPRPHTGHERPQALMIRLHPLQLLDPTRQGRLNKSDRQFRPSDRILAALAARKLSMLNHSRHRYGLDGPVVLAAVVGDRVDQVDQVGCRALFGV